jgi:6-phosphofructokinase 1
MAKEKLDFSICVLGEAAIPSPISLSKKRGDYIADYVSDDEYILYDIEAQADANRRSFARTELLEKAGPREKIYFEPAKVRAGNVTCGGLCPGLNDVIRAIVMCLWYRYGVKQYAA